MPALVQSVSSAPLQPASVGTIKQQNVFSKFATTMKGKDQNAKLALLADLQGLAASAAGKASPDTTPYLVSVLGLVISRVSDIKGGVSKAAEATAKAIVRAVDPNAIKAILPVITERIADESARWQETALAIQLLNILVETAPVQLPLQLSTFYQALIMNMNSSRAQIRKVAKDTMLTICNLIDNPDVKSRVPQLVEAMDGSVDIATTISTLNQIVWVRTVTTPVLALMEPILGRGLSRNAPTATRYLSAKITDVMCKVVTDPRDAAVYIPTLHQQVTKCMDAIADMDTIETCRKALTTMENVGKYKDGQFAPVVKAGHIDVVLALLKEVVASKALPASFEPVLVYIAGLASQLVDDRNAEVVDWNKAVIPFLAPSVMSEQEAREVAETFRKRASASYADDVSESDDEEDGEDLCKIDRFTLAYSSKLLLKDAAFHAKRGRRYLVLGPNGTGKSTLLTKMSQGDVENFPPPEEMKCVLVAVEAVNSAKAELTLIDFVKAGSPNATDEEIKAALRNVDFTEEYIDGVIGSLSGGWKMKLALANAMLQKADILLLDEPTNHLDKYNVDWLANFLLNQKTVSSLIVSHDAKFMQRVGQGIFHYEGLKLVKYNMDLHTFAKQNPKTMSYLKLEHSLESWKFPVPTLLDGVKHANTPFLKVKNMSFQYPGTAVPQLRDIKFQCSRTSRIAIVGRNGAGKSTLVKVLIGDLEPTPESDITRHENAIISYMSQSAFELLGDHVDKTPYEYLEYRFKTGEDSENQARIQKLGVAKADKGYTENLEKVFKWDKDSTHRKVVAITGRTKNKRTFLYECETKICTSPNPHDSKAQWIPTSTTDNIQLPGDLLMQSHKEMKEAFDLKLIRDGPNYRPITRKALVDHCKDVGMDQELTLHARIGGMSGGQKVRMLLAGATWLRPHLIVLDEPSNFLDRDSLGALAKALRAFEGGVVVISHSQEFLESISTEERKAETWLVDAGRMTPSGTNWESKGEKIDLSKEGETTITDAMGNVDKKKKMVKPDRKAEMRMKKAKKAAEKAGEYFDEQEWYQNNL